MAARKRDAERIRDANRSPALPPKEKTATTRLSHETLDFLKEPVEIPAPDPDWHPAALRWYESLARSGQHIYYEPSDWATAWMLAESLSRDLKPQFVGVTQAGPDQESEPIYAPIPFKGASLTAYRTMMAALLVTEAQRRSFSLEIDRLRVNDVIAPTLYLAASRDEAFDEAQ